MNTFHFKALGWIAESCRDPWQCLEQATLRAFEMTFFFRQPMAFLIKKRNTTLAALGALAHCLQHLTACLIQNVRRGLKICQNLGFWIKFSEVSGSLINSSEN